MNRYVRAAAGKEPPVASLDIDAPLTCPGEVSLAEVEQLDQLEPYGAGNPRPVFALLGATVDAIQPVGQGKHLKFRLSKGTCRFDAIFFSVTAEECGVAPGARVDAAFYLQANTFRGATTLQLQLIDIRPSLTPSRHEAADLDLIRRLVAGEVLTCQEQTRLQASRGQFAAYWTALDHRLRRGEGGGGHPAPPAASGRRVRRGRELPAGRPGPGRLFRAGADLPVRPGGPGDAGPQSHPGKGGSVRLPLSVPAAAG